MFVNMKTNCLRLTALTLILLMVAGCTLPAATDSSSNAAVSDAESSWGVSGIAEPAVSELPVFEHPIPEQNAASVSDNLPETVPSEEYTPVSESASASEPEPVETYGSQEVDQQIAEILAGMTPEEKAAQLFVVTPEALTGFDGSVTAAGDLTREAYNDIPVGGIVYMGNNLETSEQTRTMLADMQEISMDRIGLPALLCVDEEGGTVARISGVEGFDIPEYPDMCDIGASGDTVRAREIGEEMGAYLSDLGFNVDFAPVADIWSNEENAVVKYRAFSSDPDVVASMTAAFSEGLSSFGVLASYKHFPGHGNTAADSHAGFAESDADLSTLRERELIPFQDGIERGAPMIMVGHISLPNVTEDDLPASLSGIIITDLLRHELGYDGIVITDALNMGAIADNYSSGEAALMALQAGADLLLMPVSFSAAYETVKDAIRDGTLSEQRVNESLERILRAKLQLME